MIYITIIAPNTIKGPVQLAAEARKMRQAVYNVEEIEIYPHLAANHTKKALKPLREVVEHGTKKGKSRKKPTARRRHDRLRQPVHR